jgi:hypothetical protein
MCEVDGYMVGLRCMRGNVGAVWEIVLVLVSWVGAHGEIRQLWWISIG